MSTLDEAIWLRHLPEDEIRQLCADLVRAIEQGHWRALEQAVREWRSTALVHADPVLAGRLRGPIGDEAS